MLQGSFGERLARSFHVSNPSTLVSALESGQTLAVTEIHVRSDGHGFTDPMGREDAYLVGLQLNTVDRFEFWQCGKLVTSSSFKSGTTGIYDLRAEPALYFNQPFHHLSFYIPRTALMDACGDSVHDCLRDLALQSRQGVDDFAIRNIGTSLLPYIKDANLAASNQLVVDYLLLAVRMHVALTYGCAYPANITKSFGLAPWQQRRAKELMNAHLFDGVSLTEVAASCQLSLSAFVRAFKKSLGTTPHQWFLARRIEHAIKLMEDDDLPLVDVALSSGFSDQSHFTRSFARKMGVSPGAYRRLRGAAVA